MRVIATRGDKVLLRHAVGIPGRHPVRGGGMIVVFVSDRPHQRDLVHVVGEVVKVLADVDAGHIGLDRLERTAVIRRRVGLQIECVLLSGTSAHPQNDTPFGAAEAARLARASCAASRLMRRQSGQAERQRRKRAHTQPLAASDSVTQLMRFRREI